MSKLDIPEPDLVSNCCSAGDDMGGNLGDSEGICSDCKEHCEMEGL